MKHRSRIATAVVAAFFAMTNSGFVSHSLAADHVLQPKTGPIALPVQGGKVLGFTAKIEMGASGGPGYNTIQIDVNSVGTFTADRRFTFVLESLPPGYSPPANGLRYEIPVNVAQGDKSKRVIRYLPKWSVGEAYAMSVLEDNRLLEDYRIDFGSQLRQRRGAPVDSVEIQNQVQWLFIQDTDADNTANLPDVTKLILSSMDSSLLSQSFSKPAAFTGLTPSQVGLWRQHFSSTGRLQLPSDWRGYLRHDVVVIRERTIDFLRTSATPQWQALRDWVLNGGSIVAYDAPSDRSTADVLNFGVPAERDKRFVLSTASRVQIAMVDAATRSGDSGSNELAKIKRYTPSQLSERISSLPVGAGLVVGLRKESADDFPDSLYWRIVVDLVSFRRSPAISRGVDPLIGDGRFRRWLIPGVAQPPVYTFMGLLTCFVVLVGPIAYRKTTKYGRGYLMFAIAPVLAMTTTLAMFGYGIVADGFGTVARIRQLTWVDGESGDAGERVRATYFAGVRPTTGLTFPGDAEVSMYPENVGQSWEELNQLSYSLLGTLRITDGAQVFDNSFLPSRQQRQFVIHQPRRKIGRLVIKQASGTDPSVAPTVSSTFAFTLRDLIFRDQAGRYWAVQRVPPDADVPSTPLILKEISKALGSIYNRYRPIAEVRNARDRNRYQRDTRDLIGVANREIFDTTRVITDGVFEQWLQESLQLNGELPKSTFVALADVSPDMIAVPDTELIESARYVFGTLP